MPKKPKHMEVGRVRSVGPRPKLSKKAKRPHKLTERQKELKRSGF